MRCIFMVLFIMLAASTVYAEIDVSTGADLRLEYNDNIDLDSDNEKDDFIATVSPNITLTVDTAMMDLSLTGSFIIEKYLDHTENDRIGANGDGGLNASTVFSLYKDLISLRVSDTYSRELIDVSDRAGEGNTKVNQTDTNRFEVNPYLLFQPRQDTSFLLGYTYTNLWYKEPEGDDAESHLHTAALTHQLSDRITTTLSGSFLQQRPKNPDKVVFDGEGGSYEYDQESVSLGLSYQMTERLLVSGSYGHSWLDYFVREDSDSQTWSASVDYEFNSAYSAGAEISNDYTVSVEDGPSEAEHMMAYLQYDDRFTIRGSVFADNSSYVEIVREDDSYGGELTGELPFNDKMGINGFVRYANYDRKELISVRELNYSSSLYYYYVYILNFDPNLFITERFISDNEQFDRYHAGCSFYYDTRLGRLSAGYTFTRKNSDIDVNDYTNNIFFVNAALRF